MNCIYKKLYFTTTLQFKILIPIIIILLFTTCVNQDINNEKKKSELGNIENSNIGVNVLYSRLGSLTKHINSEGRAQALRKTPLIFEKSAYLNHLSVKEGVYVKKGSLIARLQNERETITVQETRAALIKSITDFASKTSGNDSAVVMLNNSVFKSSGNNPFSPSEFENKDIDLLIKQTLAGQNRTEVLMAASGLSQAYTNYQKSLVNYNRTFFYAPFNGHIGDLTVKQGEFVTAGQQVAVLYDLSKIKIEVEILESEAPFVKTGSTCTINFPSLRGIEFTGKIYEKNIALDTEKHTLRVTVLLDNGVKGIRPGITALVKIRTISNDEALLVPKEAVLERDGRQLVFVVRDSIANWCYITPGESNEKYIQVLDSEFNLQPGEPVITEGHFTLAHGAKVSINPNNPITQ